MRVLLLSAVLTAAAALLWLLLRRRQSIVYPPPSSLIVEPEAVVTVKRQPDGTYDFRWTPTDQHVTIYVGSDPDAIDQTTPLVETDAATGSPDGIIVAGLPTTQRHYFAVKFGDQPAHIVAERVIPLQGVQNFRDLGGYPTADGRMVRWGRIYRSGALSHMTAVDAAFVNGLGVQLVCDLRSAEERLNDPDSDLIYRRTNGYQPIPIVSDQDASRRARALLFDRSHLTTLMIEAYTDLMLYQHADAFGRILRHLAAPDNLPAVVHCTAGKDRAGLASALLLLALGVPDDLVVADYTLSNQFYDTFYAYAEKMIKPFTILGVRTEDLQPLLTADAETMRAVIADLRARYGSVAAYLETAAGVDAPTLARLRDLLLV
ncbi:MAG: tyrosine-protein phosphatase [Chloroflexi bacterium]|nr:tyrosine-protein phosphatase [Chloroflexota bacterium]